jgi:hypothetical protein
LGGGFAARQVPVHVGGIEWVQATTEQNSSAPQPLVTGGLPLTRQRWPSACAVLSAEASSVSAAEHPSEVSHAPSATAVTPSLTRLCMMMQVSFPWSVYAPEWNAFQSYAFLESQETRAAAATRNRFTKVNQLSAMRSSARRGFTNRAGRLRRSATPPAPDEQQVELGGSMIPANSGRASLGARFATDSEGFQGRERPRRKFSILLQAPSGFDRVGHAF